jgi:1-acyl-sn-glycerol-3-phosphate acyltransferase
VLIWAALPGDLRAVTRPIAARDYWTSSPLKAWITREIFNCGLRVAPAHRRQDPLEPLAEALKSGDSLVIFPEGTRGSKGDPQAFKSGLYHLAQQFPGVSLVPAWIDNVQRVMPKGEVVPVPCCARSPSAHRCSGPGRTSAPSSNAPRAVSRAAGSAC